MKKLLILILTICFMFAIVGCGSKEKKKNESELYNKSIAILDEFKDDNRVKDFRKAYDLLITLPNDEDDFIEELENVNKIYTKYGKKIGYGAILLHDAKYGFKIKQDRIEEYISESAYADAKTLMELLVYPVLMEKYGAEAQNIKGLKYGNVLNAMMTYNDCRRIKQQSDFMYRKEEWICINRNGVDSRYSLRYHKNGLVEWIKFPLVTSNEYISDRNWKSYFTAKPEIRKEILTNNIIKLLPYINLFNEGYNILKHIYTDEEIHVLNNYLHSLTINDIWENDVLTKISSENGDKPLFHSASLSIYYKGHKLGVTYNINTITLSIIGNNEVNPLSHRWDTLLCGLIYPNDKKWEETYKNTINNNTAVNQKIGKYYFDLNVNAKKYSAKDNTKNVQKVYEASTTSKTDFVIDTKYYTVKVPASWSNDCIYKIQETNNHAYNLTFYEKLSHQKNGDGQLFSIMLYPGFEDYTTLPDYNYLGNLKIKDLGTFNVIITYPTDITFSEEYVEKYNDLKEAIPYVLKNITFKEGYTFSNQPNK